MRSNHTLPHHPHPAWCDSRMCRGDDCNVSHTSNPTRIRVGECGEQEVRIGVSRYDQIEVGHPIIAGLVEVWLQIEDLGSMWPENGRDHPIKADSHMPPTDAVKVMEALHEETGRAEKLNVNAGIGG